MLPKLSKPTKPFLVFNPVNSDISCFFKYFIKNLDIGFIYSNIWESVSITFDMWTSSFFSSFIISLFSELILFSLLFSSFSSFSFFSFSSFSNISLFFWFSFLLFLSFFFLLFFPSVLFSFSSGGSLSI